MNILQICLKTLADLLLLFVIFKTINIFTAYSYKLNFKNALVSSVLICVIGIISYTMLSSQVSITQFLLLIINQSKFCLAVILAYKCCSIKIICTVLIIQFSSELLSYIVQLIIPNEFKIKSDFLSAIVLCLVRAILLIILIIAKRRSQNITNDKIFHLIPNHIYILLLMSCFLSSGLTRIIDFNTSSSESKNQIIKLLSLLLVFCLIAILISLLTNVMLKKYYSDMSVLLENQVQIQINHYEKREKSNTEIRKFKHDYINHMSCVKSLIKAEKYTEAFEYLNNISEIFPADSFLYNTGNYISDAILSDKQENVKNDNITISFSGTIPSFINNIDLCIILSNAVDNAIEASLAVKDEKNIEVFGDYKQGYFILTVKNPTTNSVDTNKKIPQTTKADSIYHGFGLQNIKNVVEKYNGFMKIECKDNYFILSLTFNNVK